MPVEKVVAAYRFWRRKPTRETRWCYYFTHLRIRERFCCTRYDGTEDGTYYAWKSWNWPLRWREIRKGEWEWCGRRLLTPV